MVDDPDALRDRVVLRLAEVHVRVDANEIELSARRDLVDDLRDSGSVVAESRDPATSKVRRCKVRR